jgi:hypothetical protein
MGVTGGAEDAEVTGSKADDVTFFELHIRHCAGALSYGGQTCWEMFGLQDAATGDVVCVYMSIESVLQRKSQLLQYSHIPTRMRPIKLLWS